MVAIVSGSSLGLSDSSLSKLGLQGVFGNAARGTPNGTDYVNVSSGNLILQDVDGELAGLGGGVSTIQTYNSEGMGNGWHLGLSGQCLLIKTRAGVRASTIFTSYADGQRLEPFQKVADGQYRGVNIAGGVADTLDLQSDGTWLLTNGTTHEKSIYAGSGSFQLLATIDENGNTTSYTYGTNGLLASVTDASGETVYYDYDGSNNLVDVRSIVDDGTTTTTSSIVSFTYDDLNRLVSASVQLGASGDDSYTTSYTYDGTSNRITSVTGPSGPELTVAYIFDSATGLYKVAAITDGNGATTSFSYSATSTTVTDGAGNVMTYEFDGTSKNLTSVYVDTTVNGAPQKTLVASYTYDQLNGRVTQTWNAGTVTQYNYADPYSPLTSTEQWQSPAGSTPPGSTPLQSKTVYTNDADGRVLTSTVYTNPGSIDGSVASSGGLTTRNVYDAAGNLIYQISPNGDVTQYVRASNGVVQSLIKYPGAVFDASGYTDSQAPSSAEMANWVTSLSDLSRVSRTDYSYDVRGLLSTSTTYGATLADGTGDSSTAAVTQYIYAPNGTLLSVISPTGQRTNTTYDEFGRVLTQTDAEGNAAITQYDDANRSITVTSADGTQTITVSDADGRVISITHMAADGSALGTTHYQYDADGHLLMTQDPTGIRTFSLYDQRGYKVADIDADGVLTQYTHDLAGRVTSQTVFATPVDTTLLVDGSGNAINGQLSSIALTANPADQTTTFTYDPRGRLVQTISPSGIASVTVYDGASRVVSQTTYATPVDASGITVASADDRTLRYFHDDDGNLIGSIDATGALTTYRYDAAGRQIQTTRFANVALTPPGGGADTVLADYLPDADSQRDITSYTLYDDRGQAVGQIDGNGYLTETVYDGSGNAARVIRYATAVVYTSGAPLSAIRPATSSHDQVTQYVYTPDNQVATKTTPDGTVTQYVYDSMGRLVTTIAAAGTADVRTLSERYDSLGRLVGELTGDGSALLSEATTQGQIDAIWARYGTAYTYDAAGRRTSATDADGHRTLYYYDSDGRLTATINALGETTQTVYDAFGRVASTIRYSTRINLSGLAGGVIDTDLENRLKALSGQLDAVTTYTYNLNGTEASATDANGNTTTYRYDSFGDRVAMTQPIDWRYSVETDYRYDADGRLIGETDDALGLAVQTSKQYDVFGRLVSSTDPNGNTMRYAYDRSGNQIASTDALGYTTTIDYDAFGRVLSRTDALGATTTYAYDEAERATIVTTPEGVSLTTKVNEFGQTDSVTDGNGNVTHYSYDADGNLTGVTAALSHTTSAYDAADNLISTTDANGTLTQYSYDAANRVLARVVDPSGLKLATLYSYDAFGHQVSTTDPSGLVTLILYDRDGHVSGQIVDPNGLNLMTTYDYDDVGRRIQVNSPSGMVTLYQYDKLGRLADQMTDAYGARLMTSYEYDSNGNVLLRWDATNKITYYAYDADNRQVYAVDPTGAVTATQYDADGRVTRTTTYATPISTSGLAPSPAAIAARVVSVPNQDATEYSVYDAAGRVTWTVDGAGSATSRTYDAAGNVVRAVTYANRLDAAQLAELGTPGFVPTPVADPAHDWVVQTVYDAQNRAIYALDGTGAVTETHYDAAGNVVDAIGYAARISAQTAATQVAISAAVAAIANPASDRHVRNVYDAAGRLTYTANGVGAVTHYLYDGDGRVVRTIDYAQTIAATASPASVTTSANDRTSDNIYDSVGRLEWAIDASGAVTQNIFDANGNVVQSIAYAHAVPVSSTPYSATSLLPALVADSQHDRVTTYAYDSTNRLVLTVDALGGVTKNVYDGMGRIVETIKYAQPLQGSLEGESLSSIDLAALTARIQTSAAADRTTRYALDGDGRVRYAIDPLGYVTETRYDGLGNIAAKTQYALAISRSGVLTASQVAAAIVASPGNDRTSTFTYDACGELVASSDAMGMTERFTYDGTGNKLSYTNKNGNTWTYDYDAAGNLTRQTSPQVSLASGQIDGSGNVSLNWGASTTAAIVTLYGYDAFGHVISMTEGAGRPEQRTTQYAYDAAGRQIRTIYPPVNVYAAAYDNLAGNGQAGAASRVEYTNVSLSDTVYYDAFGDAVANVDMGGNVTLKAYDKLGRVAYDVDGDGYVTGYTRDVSGNVVRLVRFGQVTNLPSSMAAALSADNNGSAISVTAAQISAVINASSVDHSTDRAIETTYDLLGRAVQVVDPQSYVYDSAAPAGAQYFVAGKTTRTTYDAFGDTVTIASLVNPLTNAWNVTTQYFDGDGRNTATIDALGYLTTTSYDAVGNITQQTQYANATASWNASGYTTPNASTQDRTVLYTYDGDNRKSSQTQVGATYSTAPNGTSTVGNLTTRYTYDGVGNLTSATTPDGVSTISYYDALGRVVAVAQGNSAGAGSSAPLTEYYRDAYGNVLAQVQHAQGSNFATLQGYSAVSSAADRITYTQYNNRGDAVAVTDGDGNTVFSSYTATAQLAKQWQTVTAADASSRTWFEAYQYDADGNRVAVVDPASTSVLQSGITTSYQSSGLVDGGTVKYLNGTNSVGVAWSSLVNATGGAVRVDIFYNTVSTLTQTTIDESGSAEYGYDEGGETQTVTTGVGSQPQSKSFAYAASQVQGGVTMSWTDQYAKVGGISQLTYLRVWQQDAAGNWQALWEGSPAQANGSGIAQVSQQQAGLDVQRSTYNAFGEVVSKGIDGAQQVYYDYDNAGNLWKTNSDDGADKVYLYDLAGDRTATIASAGAAVGNADLRTITSADQAASLTSVRRTDTVYNALGYAVKVENPVQSVASGGAQVGDLQSSAVVAQSATLVPNGSGGAVWYGTNQINLSWPTLADLGTGDIQVEVDYLTASQTLSLSTSDEGGTTESGSTDESSLTSTTITAQPTVGSITRILTVAQASSGAVFDWTDSSTGATGGISRITAVKVLKMGADGAWHQVINQSAQNQNGSYIVATSPSDVSTNVALQIAPSGSGQWQTVDPSLFVNFGDQYRFDASSLPYGAYDFRVLSTPAGGQASVTAQGTIAVAGPQVASVDIPMAFNRAGTSPSIFSWQSQGSSTTVVFNYKMAGSSTWQSLPVGDMGQGLQGVDMSVLPPGQYQYEVLYTHGGQWEPYGHSTGSVTIVPPVPAQYVGAVGYPVITAPISVGYGLTGGEWQVATDETGSPVYDAAVPAGAAQTNVVHWVDAAGNNAVFRYMPAGGSTWYTLPVNATTVTSESGNSALLDESGQPLTYYGVDIGSLPAGNYSFEILYYAPGQSSPDAHATGNLSTGGTAAGYWQTQYVTVSQPYTVNPAPPANYVVGHAANGAPVYGSPVVVGYSGSIPIFGAGYAGGPGAVAVPYTTMVPQQQQQSVYIDGHYTTQYVPVTVVPAAPSNYITGTDESGAPIYGPPVVVGTDESGAPLLGAGYQYQNGTVVAVPYTVMQPQSVWVPGYWTTQTVTVMVPTTVTPPPASNYITGTDESGSPIYGPPVVVSYNEDGTANLGQGYVWSSMANVRAVPYTAYQQVTQATNVWVPPVVEAASLSTNTPAYQPGYTIPAVPTQYGWSDTTGSSSAIESEGPSQAGQVVGGSASGPVVQSERPEINKTVDRWGNVLSVSDARAAGWVTEYQYNQNNQLIQQIQPSADGVQGAGPSTAAYFDAAGREVASRDANGNLTRYTYDSRGDVTSELHADGGVVRYTYDALGDKMSMVDADGQTTLYSYDHVGRLIQQEQTASVQVWSYNGAGPGTTLVRTGPLIEMTAYDQRGDKIATADAAGMQTVYKYDLRGDVVETDAPGGIVTRDAYDAEGRKVAEVDANNNAETWKYDYFGEVLSHTDIGGAQYFYTYDNARQLLQQTNTRGQNLTYGYDVAGHTTLVVDNALGQVTQYAYDAAGNRLREVTTQGGVTYQDNHLAYDADGRLRKVEDGDVSITYDYDANGNRTHIHTQYMAANGGGAGQDLYFAYDSMNRETVADAYDASMDISAAQGHDLAYDMNGNRIWDTSIGAVLDSSGNKSIGVVKQVYNYDALNRLVSTTYNGTLIDQRQYDADGRVVLSGWSGGTAQSFYDTLGLTDDVQFNEYDGAGRLVFQRHYNASLAEQYNITYTQYDAVGNVVQYQLSNTQGTPYTNTYTNTMVRYSGYEVASEQGTSSVFQPGTTTYQYDVNGNLVGVADSTNSANNRSFINDASGEVLQKTQGGAVERELIANGELVGTTGTGTDPEHPSSGPSPTFVDLTNFDPTYKPINASYPAPTPGAYRIAAGDTLQGMAQAAYGDSKLWYLIADANGLTSDNDLRVGQTLNIPNRVADIHNSAGDFKPYDAGAVVGGTQPNLPDPPAQSGGGGGCGAVFGIIALVIVVVVTAICQQYYAVPGEISAEAGAAGVEGTSLVGDMAYAAAVAAATDAATQLVGDAIGTHHGFDVLETVEAAGTAALSAGVTSAVPTGSSFSGMMLQGALRNATTQAVRLALHQQKSFNWMQMAESAAAAPLAAEASRFAGQALGNINAPAVFTEFVQGAVSSTVTQAMTGGKINPASVITDGFGNVQADDVRSVFEGQGQQEQALGQTQQQVMSATDVGAPGDALLFGPMGVAGGYAGAAKPADSVDGGSGFGAYGASSVLFGPGDGLEPAPTAGSYAVQPGDTVWKAAHEMYGENWQAGMALMVQANGLSTNEWGSPIIRPGQVLSAPSIDGYSGDVMSLLNQAGGQIDASNAQGLRVRSELQALQLQREASAAFASAAAAMPMGASPAVHESGWSLPDPQTEADINLAASQQTAGLLGGLATSAFRTVNSMVNLTADSLILTANQMTFGALSDTSLVQEAQQEMGQLADAALHPIDTAKAIYQGESTTWNAAMTSLQQGDNFGFGYNAGQVAGDVGQFVVPALDAGKAGLLATGRWLAPAAADLSLELGYKTGLISFVVPPSAGSVADLSGEIATERIGNAALNPTSELKLGLQMLDPATVSFTQSSVSFGKAGASYNLDTLVKSMSTDGWVGKSIDVVAMPDGTLASIDNTRVLAARQAGIDVQANVRGFDEAITDPVRQLSLTEKGNVPDTWGDAALLRINKPIQNATYPGMNPGWSVRFPYGSIYDPVVKY